jgi:hypothetical protein
MVAGVSFIVATHSGLIVAKPATFLEIKLNIRSQPHQLSHEQMMTDRFFDLAVKSKKGGRDLGTEAASKDAEDRRRKTEGGRRNRANFRLGNSRLCELVVEKTRNLSREV